MLDTQSLEWLMACERLKDEVTQIEQQCESILHRFEGLDREPTSSERDERRQDYLDNRSRLIGLQSEIHSIERRVAAHG